MPFPNSENSYFSLGEICTLVQKILFVVAPTAAGSLSCKVKNLILHLFSDAFVKALPFPEQTYLF